MFGAIVGDIIGSVYERHNIKTKDFPLFREDCRFTDDTVMTCAVAEAVMNGGRKDDFIDALSLLRCAFESIMFSLVIKIDSKIYMRYKSYNDKAFIEQ